VIEGSVVKMGDQIKVSARLINAPKNEYLWAENYEREFSNILGLQGEIAQSIAGQVKIKLTPQEETMLAVSRKVNPEAHEAYLKGLFNLYKFTPSGIETARQYFELALEKDPDFALAYAGMATVWGSYQIQGFKSALETRPKANVAMMKALELDSTLADVHYTLAVIRSWTDYEWAAGEKAFQRTLALNPNHAEAHAYYSQLLYVLKRPKEAMPHIERALELDPFNTLLRALYGMDLNYVHRSDEAIEMLRNTLRTASDVHPIVLSTLRTSYELEGMYEEALEMWKEFYAGRNDHEGLEALERGYGEAGYHGAMLRMAEMMVERSKKAYVTPWQIATLYTRAGKNSEAIDWFEMAYEQHDTNMPALSMDPLFDGLRSEPRFKDLLSRMNLPIE
jgi:tetratricopeptide (TPR) repeat protein